MWIALDIGSSQWKAGAFTADGREQAVARIPIPLSRERSGYQTVRADAVFPALCGLLNALPESARRSACGLAVTGMAEGGLLLHAGSHRPASALLPWFDSRATGLFERLRGEGRLTGRFPVTGLPDSPKYNVYKLLALLQETGLSPHGALFLGAPEFAAFLLTASLATEATLAARTHAFDIVSLAWDEGFLRSLGLPASVFPPVKPGGLAMGALTAQVARNTGLPEGLPVALCGHDHLCAAYGARAVEENSLYCSAGTAQVLLKPLPGHALDAGDQATGLSFGPAPGGGLCALGAIQSAGLSLNLLNSLLFPGEEGFAALLSEADGFQPAQGGLLYFPYLAGSGPPRMLAGARGAFIGLDADTTRAQLLHAVYQGLAFESRVILDAAGGGASRLLVAGGLSAHPGYLRALADTLALEVVVPSCREGTLLGAARLMASRAGQDFSPLPPGASLKPDARRVEALDRVYRRHYLPLRQAQLDFYEGLKTEGP